MDISDASFLFDICDKSIILPELIKRFSCAAIGNITNFVKSCSLVIVEIAKKTTNNLYNQFHNGRI